MKRALSNSTNTSTYEVSPLRTTLNFLDESTDIPPTTWVASRAVVDGNETWLGVSVTVPENAEGVLYVAMPWADEVGRDYSARRMHYIAQETGRVVVAIDQLNMGRTSEPFNGPVRRYAARIIGSIHGQGLDTTSGLKATLQRHRELEKMQRDSLSDGSFLDTGTASWTAVLNTLKSIRVAATYKTPEDRDALESKLALIDDCASDSEIWHALGEGQMLGYSLGASTIAGMQGTAPEGADIKKILFLEGVAYQKFHSRLGRLALGIKLGLSTLGAKKVLKETKNAGLSEGIQGGELVLGLLPKMAFRHYVTMGKYLPRAMAKSRLITDLNMASLRSEEVYVSVVRAGRSIVSSRRANAKLAQHLKREGVDVIERTIDGYDHMVWDSIPRLMELLDEEM